MDSNTGRDSESKESLQPTPRNCRIIVAGSTAVAAILKLTSHAASNQADLRIRAIEVADEIRNLERVIDHLLPHPDEKKAVAKVKAALKPVKKGGKRATNRKAR